MKYSYLKSKKQEFLDILFSYNIIRMDKEQKKKVCVVGGGLAGPMIGIMLAR